MDIVRKKNLPAVVSEYARQVLKQPLLPPELGVDTRASEPWTEQMTDAEPVSEWIEQLKAGDYSAARKIWNFFALPLYAAAQKKLNSATKRVYDEQDAAQSAYHALCAGVAAGRYPDLADRTGLWRLLLAITSRKITDRHRYDHREQRDLRRTATEGDHLDADASGFINKWSSRTPAPEFAAEFVELCGELFENLGDPQLRQIGWLKIEGYNDQEIADQLGCARRTVQRKVERIRRVWQQSQGIVD